MAITGILNIKTIYVIGLVAVVVLLPWSHHWSANAIVVTLFLGLLTTSPQEKFNRLKINTSVLAFIGFYFIYVIGIFYSTDRSEGMLGLEQKLFLIGLPIVAATTSQLSYSNVRILLLAFILSNLALTFTDIGLAILSSIHGDHSINNFDVYTQAKFSNTENVSQWSRFGYIALSNKIIDPTYFSVYLVFSIAILIFFQTKLVEPVKWIIAIWFGIFVLMLASRMGIALLGIVLLLAIYLKMETPHFKKVVTAILTMGLLSSIVYLLPITRYRMIDELLSTSSTLPTNSTQWNSTNLRLMEWKSTLKGIEMAGPLGTGTGGTWPVLKQSSAQYNLGVFSGVFNSHNQYLETFLEIGIAGFIGLLACYFFPLSQAVQTKNFLLLSFSLLICLASLTESILERAHGLIFFTTFASILMYSNPYDRAA
jgi:hypothetical protein